MGETGNFPVCADWKRQLDTQFYQESTSAKTENGNFPANVLGLLGLIAASLVLPQVAALDYAESNVRVNAVCPGIVDTPMMERFAGATPEGRARVIAQEPIGRMGNPEEIAAAVLWLCSDAASFIVGHAMVVDGGQTVP
jgi:enoyl-[acyl-carrier-protein] reductase (NADH)